MKWFWYSLIGFCLLMCSCSSKKSVSGIGFGNKDIYGVEYGKYQALSDTANVLRIGIDKSKLTITEHIINTKYDKDTGAVTETTETKRKVVQDSDKVVSEEETKEVVIHSEDTLNHFRDLTQKVESESKTIKENHGFVSVWERFGEVMGVGALVVIVYICWKLKSRVN